MKIIAIVFFTLILFAGQDTYSHEGKKHHTQINEQANESAQDSKNATRDTVITKPPEHNHEKEEETEGQYVLNVAHEMLEHVHNKIVHFTVSLSLVAFLFTMINFRWKFFDNTIKILVIISAVSALFAVFTGLNQAGAFKGDPKEWVVQLHEKLGIASTVLLCIWSGSLILMPLKRYAWIAGAVVFILVSIAGFYGGIAAH